MTTDQLQPIDEEILVMDETGQFKILSGGQLKSLEEFSGQPAAAQIAAAGEEENEEANLKPILPMDTGYEEKMLQPPPPALYKKTSSFYFHPADEEEAAKHRSIASPTGERKRYSLDKILAKVLENYKLLEEPELVNRLRLGLFSFLRDRRSAVDTKELFLRAKENGGLGLKPELADNLLEFLREIKQKIETQSGMVVDEKEPAPAEVSGQFKERVKPIQPLEPKLSAEIPQAVKLEPSAANPVSPIIPVRPAVSQPVASPLASISKPSVKTPLPDLPSFKPKTAPIASSRFMRPIKEGEKRMADVKKDYKLVGPVEELALLNLETFRRLGATPDERAQKISAKINLLAKDSLAKKAQGINAWRQSPLYRMYLAIGQASMEHGLDLVGVISEYSSQGKEIISLDEFNAITNINKQLRF